MSGPPGDVGYARRVGLFAGTMLVVGGIIGSGIFLNPAVVAQRAGSAGRIVAVWVGGGAVALAGAFIFGELGARRPSAGGGYVYLREAYGPLPAFLYGWTLLLVMATGAIAAVATTFASYLAALVGLGPAAVQPLALGAIVVLSLINVVGVAPGAATVSGFTVLKLAALAGLVGLGLLLPVPAAPPAPALRDVGAPVVALAAALAPVLFAYGGWQQTNFVAAELVDAERNLPRALLLGVAIVVAVYLGANLVYLRVLGAPGLAASPAPAADVMERLLGPAGRTAIALGIAASTFGFLDLVILVSPRVYQAMAADGSFLPALAQLHPRFRTPVRAIVLQWLWAALLTLTGTYGDMLDYVVFGDWIFFGLIASTLVVLRRRDGAEAGFGVPGWPVTLGLFLAAAVYVVGGAVAANPGNALKGFVLILAGVPAYLWQRGRVLRVRGEPRPPH